MSYLKQLTKEIRETRANENHCRSLVVKLQSAYLKDNPQCKRCGATKNITYDHIIPCSILHDFNIDPLREFWEENSQSLCHACNTIKANRLDFANLKTALLLKELLDKKLSTVEF